MKESFEKIDHLISQIKGKLKMPSIRRYQQSHDLPPMPGDRVAGGLREDKPATGVWPPNENDSLHNVLIK